jgi:serine/threonine-protein kinase
MGKIYEAIQQPLGRRIALKVMDLGFAEDLDPDFQKRFFLEASTCAKLSHPNTVRVFDYGSTGEEHDTYFIAMEFIEGRTLLRLIEESAPLSPLRMIHIGRQICASLREAHEMGVIHRDLKPSNVLLTTHGEQVDFVKVLDFGLVKLMQEDAEEMTKTGLFLGSPNYMSPEQIRSDKIDQRSDLYSLGVLLYMGLTATSPFKRESSVKVLLAHLEDAPEPFSSILPKGLVPPSLEWVVMTCLQKDPERRFGSVAELSRALKACGAEIRGLTGPLQMSVEAGRLMLSGEVSDLLDYNSQPATITRGELQAARSRSGKTYSGVGPTPGKTVAESADDDDDLRPTELSLPAMPRQPSPRRPKTKKTGTWGLLAGLVALVLLAAGVLLFINLRALPSPEGTAEQLPNVVIQDIATERAAGNDPQPSEPKPAREGQEANANRTPTATSGTSTPKTRSGANRTSPQKRTRRRPARTSSGSKVPSKNFDRAKQVPAAREPRSDVGSVPQGEEEGSNPQGATSESTPPRKKKGDLRDPWGD